MCAVAKVESVDRADSLNRLSHRASGSAVWAKAFWTSLSTLTCCWVLASPERQERLVCVPDRLCVLFASVAILGMKAQCDWLQNSSTGASRSQEVSAANSQSLNVDGSRRAYTMYLRNYLTLSDVFQHHLWSGSTGVQGGPLGCVVVFQSCVCGGGEHTSCRNLKFITFSFRWFLSLLLPMLACSFARRWESMACVKSRLDDWDGAEMLTLRSNSVWPHLASCLSKCSSLWSEQ